MKSTWTLLKVLSTLLAVIGVFGISFVLHSVKPWHNWGEGKSLIKAGESQAKLRARIFIATGIELTDSEVIKNAHYDPERTHTYWYEVSFDPNKSSHWQEMLLGSGFEIETEKSLKSYIERRLPLYFEIIAKWWAPDRLEKSTMYIRRDRMRPACFLDEGQGILFITTHLP